MSTNVSRKHNLLADNEGSRHRTSQWACQKSSIMIVSHVSDDIAIRRRKPRDYPLVSKCLVNKKSDDRHKRRLAASNLWWGGAQTSFFFIHLEHDASLPHQNFYCGQNIASLYCTLFKVCKKNRRMAPTKIGSNIFAILPSRSHKRSLETKILFNT